MISLDNGPDIVNRVLLLTRKCIAHFISEWTRFRMQKTCANYGNDLSEGLSRFMNCYLLWPTLFRCRLTHELIWYFSNDKINLVFLLYDKHIRMAGCLVRTNAHRIGKFCYIAVNRELVCLDNPKWLILIPIFAHWDGIWSRLQRSRIPHLHTHAHTYVHARTQRQTNTRTTAQMYDNPRHISCLK